MTSKKKLKRKVKYWRAHARAYLEECRDVYRDLSEYMLFVRPEPATRADDDRLEAEIEARHDK